MPDNKIIQIKCPSCHQPIGIKNQPGVDALKIKCPFCSLAFTVKFNRRPIRLEEGHASNLSSGQQLAADDETEFGNVLANTGNPMLLVNGAKHSLKLGRNTVGRKSSESSATLQLPVADRYMSRVNAVIEVYKVAQGKWYVTIASCNERNLVKVNEHSVQMGDKMVLQSNYVIRLGHTNIVFTLE